MGKFRKKPVVIEAMQWDGHNTHSIMEWVQPGIGRFEMADGWWLKQDFPAQSFKLMVPTLESPHEASEGDWIIKGVKGEFYPCKPDIFEATYEATD